MERSEIIALIKSNFLFRQYSEEDLEMIVDQFRIWDYEKGQLIFEQGSPAEHLFLVYRGKVFLTHHSRKDKRSLGLFESGDLFGYDMLKYDNLYQCTAVAQTETTVLWLDQESTSHLLQNLPALHEDLQILFESYLLDLQIPLSWREPNEVVYFISRRHPLDLVNRLVPPAGWTLVSMIILAVLFNMASGKIYPWILTGVDAGVILLWFILAVIDWSNDFSIVTNRRVVFQEKVILLYDTRHESPLRMVLSVTTQTDWLGRQFSYGDILIRTYAGQVCFPKVPSSRKIAVLIDVQTERAKSGLQIEEQTHLEEMVRETIGLRGKAKDIPVAEKKVVPELQSGSLVSGLADLFRLRKEENGVLTYWTHWYILLKRIGLPTIILLVLLASLVARVLDLLTFIELKSLLAILFVSVPVVVLWWIYQYYDWRNDQYIITADQVIDVYKKPFGREERRAAPLKNILSIEFERLGLVGLLLNFGTVYIKIGETTLTFDYVYNPSDVQRELFSRLAARDEIQKNQEKLAIQKNVAGWIEAYHKVSTGKDKSQSYFPEKEENSF